MTNDEFDKLKAINDWNVAMYRSSEDARGVDKEMWKKWIDRLYEVRSEPDKLLIMITNKHYEMHRWQKDE